MISVLKNVSLQPYDILKAVDAIETLGNEFQKELEEKSQYELARGTTGDALKLAKVCSTCSWVFSCYFYIYRL